MLWECQGAALVASSETWRCNSAEPLFSNQPEAWHSPWDPLWGICPQKILVDGLDVTAKKLSANAVSKTTCRIVIPADLAPVDLSENDVTKLATQRAQAVQLGGGYLLPSLPNYPVIDSAYIDENNKSMMLQMEAGRSKKLSADKMPLVHQALGNVFVVVIPEENIVTKKLAGGPAVMNQYVAILNKE